MKNLLLLGLVLLALYLYLHPQTEAPAPVPPPVVAQAAPPPPKKMYYHSPLDAGAMPTNASTGTGYYSSDPTVSRFNNGRTASASAPAANSGYPVYYGGNTSVNNTTIYTGSANRSTAAAQPTPHDDVSSRRPNYTGNSTAAQRNALANP